MIGFKVCKECGNELQEMNCSCLLTKRSCVVKNQNAVSVELIMSVLDRIGDCELLEKRNEGYERD